MVHPLCLTSHQAKQPNQITCGGIQGREFKTNMVQRESLLVQVCSIQSMCVGQLNGKLFGMKPFLDSFYLHPPYVCAGGWAERGIFGGGCVWCAVAHLFWVLCPKALWSLGGKLSPHVLNPKPWRVGLRWFMVGSVSSHTFFREPPTPRSKHWGRTLRVCNHSISMPALGGSFAPPRRGPRTTLNC